MARWIVGLLLLAAPAFAAPYRVLSEEDFEARMEQKPEKVHPRRLTHAQAADDLRALDKAVREVWRHRWERGPEMFETDWILEKSLEAVPAKGLSWEDFDEIAQRFLNTLEDDHAYVMAAGDVLGRIREPSTPVHFTRLAPDIGLLRIDRFPEPGQPFGNEFPELLERAFAALRDTKGLILDLRRNAGGDPNQTDRLFDHLASTHVVLYHEVVRRSDAMERYLGPEKVARWTWKKGGTFSEPYTIIHELEPVEHPYKGKVLALSDRDTVSAGEYLLAELVDNKLARSAGERTPGHTGSVVPIELPNSRLVIALPVQHVLRLNQKTLQHTGVVPRYPLDPRAKDVLAKATELLRRWIAEEK